MRKNIFGFIAFLALGATPLKSAVITVGLDDAVSTYAFSGGGIKYSDPLFLYEPGDHAWESYLSFDLAAAGIDSSAYITNATLRLRTDATGGAYFLYAFGGIEASGDYNFQITDAASAWNSSTITWGGKPGSGSLFSETVPFTYTQTEPFPDAEYEEYWIEVNLTTLAQYWADNPTSNFGLRLYIDSGVASFVGDSGNAFAPQLVITTVPEPGSASLLLLGGAGLLVLRRWSVARFSLQREA